MAGTLEPPYEGSIARAEELSDDVLTAIEKYIYRRDRSSAQRLGRTVHEIIFPENVDSPEPVQRPLTLRGCVFTLLVSRYILRASSSDHRGENENAFFSPV